MSDEKRRIAAVLRYAAGLDLDGLPRGIHVALRDLDAADIGDAVWSAYYAVKTETPGCHRSELLEAAACAEASRGRCPQPNTTSEGATDGAS